MRRICFALILLFGAALRVEAWPVDPKVYCAVDLSYNNLNMLTSKASASYSDNLGNNPAPAKLTGSHAINGDDGSVPAMQSFENTTGTWAGTISGGITAPTTTRVCYQGVVSAATADASQGAGSGRICFDPPPPPPPPGSDSDLAQCPTSPIIFNLGHRGYELSGIDDPVRFDIDADGGPNVMAWTASGAEMAFLALDRNGNGTIDNGSELFGDHTVLASGKLARNGFEALGEYDTNGDGVIDAADPIWTQLSVWIDRNHDAISTADEMQRIDTTPITAIELSYHTSGRVDRSGNMFRYEALVHMGARTGPFYDVYFLTRR